MTMKWAAAALIAMMGLSSCSSTESAPAANLAGDLAHKVSVDAIYAHLRKFQEIADANRGNRAEGTPGYDASVDYVVNTLKNNGFDVQTTEFERLDRMEGGRPALNVAGR